MIKILRMICNLEARLRQVDFLISISSCWCCGWERCWYDNQMMPNKVYPGPSAYGIDQNTRRWSHDWLRFLRKQIHVTQWGYRYLKNHILKCLTGKNKQPIMLEESRQTQLSSHCRTLPLLDSDAVYLGIICGRFHARIFIAELVNTENNTKFCSHPTGQLISSIWSHVAVACSCWNNNIDSVTKRDSISCILRCKVSDRYIAKYLACATWPSPFDGMLKYA